MGNFAVIFPAAGRSSRFGDSKQKKVFAELDGRAVWLYSLLPSRRGAHLRGNPAIAVVVDAGLAYGELRGVELAGHVEGVGEHPRTGEPCPEAEEAERLWAARYLGGHGFPHDGRHGWLRLVPEREVSWDFRKLGG